MTDEKSHSPFLTRLNRLFIFLLLIAVLGVIFYPRYKKGFDLRMQEEKLDAQVQEKEEHEKKLKETQKALIYNPDSLEKVARDKMGYSGSNEIIYQFEDGSQEQK